MDVRSTGLPSDRPPPAGENPDEAVTVEAVQPGRAELVLEQRHHENVGGRWQDARMTSIAAYWDTAAGTFDEEADHGLRDPEVRAAWAARLAAWVPRGPLDVLDLGCGTGSLSLLLAERGHRVLGVDLAPRMVERARAKLSGTSAAVLVADAARPPVGERSFDVVLARHLLWTIPDPEAALARWAGLLRPGGRLVLVEGRWGTPAEASGDSPGAGGVSGDLPWAGGVGAGDLVTALRPIVADVRVDPLTDPALWGKEIDDERYAVVALT
ncbi:class I SAM-dependent methyltransferase [Nonomuraea sp. M3C6]|uniref:Class I SAM-dependent methyltransferase n=1 Tax=Nonomuraea marmarensis TaxID=3351344 RepID=A0ABW7AHG7_9ACTN